MRILFITTSLAVLISANIFANLGQMAAETKPCSNEFCQFYQSYAKTTNIEKWMIDPQYFHPLESTSEAGSAELENWMLDMHHFCSAVIEETANLKLESWMTKSNHFYSAIVPVISRFQNIEVRKKNMKIVIAKK